MERWQTVFDANASSRANAAYLGFGIGGPAPKRYGWSSLIRF